MVICIKPVMLTLCKQGVGTHDIPRNLSDASQWRLRPSPVSDYVRYGASVSRPPGNPAAASPSPDDRRGGPARRDGERPGPIPGGAKIVAFVAAAEATALLAAAGWYAYELLSGSPVLSFWGAVFTLGLLLAFSAWLFTVGVFLYRGYRWTRAAALVAQLFALTIGVPALTSGLLLPGLAMVVPAIIAIILLFSTKVINYASRTGSPPPAL